MLENMPEKHESYGALEISRSQRPSTALFGSSIMHENTIRLRISSAELERHHNRDRVFPSSLRKNTFIEVEMSYAQFAEAITSLNNGMGVPVTVRYANGRTMEPCPFTSKDEQFRAEFNADLREIAAAVDGALARAKTLFDSKKPLTKAEKDELLAILGNLSMEVNSNIPFVRDSFVEQMDKTVAEAKGNIEGFLQNRMAAIANAAIAQEFGPLYGVGGAEALSNDDAKTSGEKTSVMKYIRDGVPPGVNKTAGGGKSADVEIE